MLLLLLYTGILLMQEGEETTANLPFLGEDGDAGGSLERVRVWVWTREWE